MIWCNSVAATSKLGLMSCITKESISNIRLKLKDKQNSKYKPSRTAQNLNNQIGHNQDKSVKQTRFLLPTSKTCTKPNAHYNCTSRYPDSKYSIKLLWWENDTYMIQCLRRFFLCFLFSIFFMLSQYFLIHEAAHWFAETWLKFFSTDNSSCIPFTKSQKGMNVMTACFLKIPKETFSENTANKYKHCA